MNTVTIEQLEARHNELAKLIESFKAALPTTGAVPGAEIELAQGERYAGLILSEQGTPSHHLILLPGDAEDLTWEQASAFAEKQGGQLPTRAEQSLLFANLKGEFQGTWYWSGQQHEKESGWAWYQYFGSGHQLSHLKCSECRARAVRRLVIE